MRIIPREVEETKPITWSKKIRRLQKRLKLTPFQEKVLIGTLLGDGCLEVNAYRKNYRLKIEHGVKQSKYTEWKYRVFEEWCLTKPKFQKRTKSLRFRTISSPVFTEYRSLFYNGRQKIVPIQIHKILKSPICLAVWFMDDGTLGPGRGGLTLNTQSFTKEENTKLMKCLEINFGLETSLHKDKKKWRLYILSASAPKFKSIVDKFILPELKYKLFSIP